MALNVDDFKAKLVGGGARANLFKVICNFPGVAGGNSELASFMIKGTNLPASTVAPIEVSFRGRKLKVAGDRTFEAWSITVINDNNMSIRNAFERWMNYINQHIANAGSSNPASYQTDMEVQQLDREGKVVKSYTFRGTFPTEISAIELNYETNDAIEEFTVAINYQYWESNTTT
jgi:hypothetical protein